MNHLQCCQYSIKLITKLKALNIQNDLDFDLINKAIYWAKKYHAGQFRKSGEPFYSHPLEVASMISQYNLTTDVITASILHDIIEDTEITIEMLIEAFGERIAEMVDRLTRDRPDGSELSVEKIVSNAYEIGDREVLLIKIIDRIHNLSTTSHLQEKKIIKQIKETCNSLLPGIAATFSLELENILFHVLHKNDTQNILKDVYNVMYRPSLSLNSTDLELPHFELKIE